MPKTMDEFNDPASLTAQSRPSGQREGGLEVRLVGPAVLALESGLDNASVPQEWQAHALLHEHYFCTLPPALWDLLETELGREVFDADLIQFERILSNRNGDHASRVGFFQSQPIPFQGLVPLPLPQWSDEQIRNAGMEPAQVAHGLRVFDEQYAPALSRFRAGYAGWLLTNPQFLREHDELLGNHLEVIRRYGICNAGSLAPTARGGLHEARLEDPAWPPFDEACRALFQRWRLWGLAGPYLPEPLMPLMAGIFPWSAIERLMDAGGIFFLPDTMPIPSRDQLRLMLDSTLHKGPKPDHLEAWLHLVRAGNSARNQLDRESRLFPLTHFFSLLQDRHASALDRNLGRTEAAFAEFFQVSKSSIHTDLIEIRQRLHAYEPRRILLARTIDDELLQRLD